MGIKVTIDPGHAGKYNAGVVKGYWESEMALKLAFMLADELHKFGIETALTRTTADANQSLSTRAMMAVKNDSNMLVSLHSNAPAANKDGTYDPNISGVVIYHSVQRPGSDKFGRVLGEAVASAMGIKLHNVATVKSTTRPGRDYYTVIDTAADNGVPDVYLIEHGFHTSPRDCTLLMDDAVLRRIAQVEARVIAEHYGVAGESEKEVKPVEHIKPNSYTDIIKIKNTDLLEIGVMAATNGKYESMQSYCSRLAKNGTDVVACNGGFFGPSVSTVYDDGSHTETEPHNFGLAVAADKLSYAFRRQEEGKEFDFIGGVPALVWNGRIQRYAVDQAYEDPHPRTFIGTDGTHIYFGTVDGRRSNKPGITLQALGQLMIDVGITHGINLDGGGSTQLVQTTGGQMAYLNSPSETPYRPVGNIVYARIKGTTERPMLRKGATGEDVRSLQSALLKAGYQPYGDFGDALDAAVRKYQADNGLGVDGVVGPKTWAKLQK